MDSNNDQRDKSENQQLNEKEGFKFAVTLLAIFGYLFYNIYNYFQNEVVSVFIFFTVNLLICNITIIIIALILYILIKGFSFEVQGSVEKQNLNKIASKIYLFIFLVFILLFPSSFGYFIYYTSVDFPEHKTIFYVFLMICVGFSMLFIYTPPLKIVSEINEKFEAFNVLQFLNKLNENKIEFKIVKDSLKKIFSLKFFESFFESFFDYSFKYLLIFFITVFGILFIFGALFPQMIDLPILFEGNINVDVENIHKKNDIMIPVQIQVTGIDVPISVGLFKVEPNNSISIAQIDNLGTQSENRNDLYHRTFSNVSNFKNDNCLLGNSLGLGKYILFINTTNLSIGYYKLEVESYKTNSGDGFFLS